MIKYDYWIFQYLKISKGSYIWVFCNDSIFKNARLSLVALRKFFIHIIFPHIFQQPLQRKLFTFSFSLPLLWYFARHSRCSVSIKGCLKNRIPIDSLFYGTVRRQHFIYFYKEKDLDLYNNKPELIPKTVGVKCPAKNVTEIFCKIYCTDSGTGVLLLILQKFSEQPGCSCDTSITLHTIYNKSNNRLTRVLFWLDSIQNEADNW